MKKYKCTVTRVDEYEIELDEKVMNDEWMEEFRKYMYNYHDLEEHVEHIAKMRARDGDSFIEGYGCPLENGKISTFAILAGEEVTNKFININVISEDDDIEVEVDEIS